MAGHCCTRRPHAAALHWHHLRMQCAWRGIAWHSVACGNHHHHCRLLTAFHATPRESGWGVRQVSKHTRPALILAHANLKNYCGTVNALMTRCVYSTTKGTFLQDVWCFDLNEMYARMCPSVHFFFLFPFSFFLFPFFFSNASPAFCGVAAGVLQLPYSITYAVRRYLLHNAHGTARYCTVLHGTARHGTALQGMAAD